MKRLGLVQYSAEEWLQRLSESKYSKAKPDSYSEGELVAELETRVAELLSKPAALFFNKGMTAQFCMLKVAEQRKNNNRFIMSPYSHLAIDEEQSYEHLLKLEAVIPTMAPRPFTTADLATIEQPVASMMVEVPLRRAGFRLPDWEDLMALKDWARSNNVHFHMDGARIWESRHYYGRSEAEIASLFDTVYVSLYKGLGGLGGALLTGEKDFISECKTWRSRFAGNHYTLFPYLISGLDGLDQQYSAMESCVERAIEIAEALNEFSGFKVPTPHTNGFLIYLDDTIQGTADSLSLIFNKLNDRMDMHICQGVSLLPYTEQRIIELQIGVNHHEISTDEILTYFKKFFSEVM